jgi:hypothetical protein
MKQKNSKGNNFSAGRDLVYVDKVKGASVVVGKVHGSNQPDSIDDNQAVTEVFDAIYRAISKKSDANAKMKGLDALKELQQQAKLADDADEDKITSSLETLRTWLPDIFEVALQTFLNPVKGLSTVFQKIANKLMAHME